MNKIVHGDMTVVADATGVRVDAVREHLRDALSIPASASAFLDGIAVPDDSVVPFGSDLEFLRVRGRKAVGRVWTPAEACDVLRCTPDDLNAWVRDGLRVLPLLDGSVRITETAVDDYIRGGQAAHVPTSTTCPEPPSIPRAGEQEAACQSDLTTLQAMAEIGCSRAMIYKLCRSGLLTYRMVGSQYRITRESVREYKRTTAVEARPKDTAEPGGYRFRHL